MSVVSEAPPSYEAREEIDSSTVLDEAVIQGKQKVSKPAFGKYSCIQVNL